MGCEVGEPVRFELSSANITAATPLTLWNAQGVARLLAADERLIILSGMMSAVSISTLIIFADANNNGVVDAGERLVVAYVAAGGAVYFEADNDAMCGVKGAIPKAKSDVAGQVDITGVGYIIKG